MPRTAKSQKMQKKHRKLPNAKNMLTKMLNECQINAKKMPNAKKKTKKC